MKKYIYYLKPVFFITLFVYTTGVIKSASLNPLMFGYKTRIVLAIVWAVVSAYWLLWYRIKKAD